MVTFEPAPDGVVMEVVSVNGSGAKAGTWTAEVATDNSGFTVHFSDFVARTGGTDSRKNAQIGVRVMGVPPDFTFAVGHAAFRGASDLAAGVTAEQLARYYYQGTSATLTLSDHRFNGPQSGFWETVEVVPDGGLFWRPCGSEANLNINVELRVRAASFISMDSVTVSDLRWKHCS